MKTRTLSHGTAPGGTRSATQYQVGTGTVLSSGSDSTPSVDLGSSVETINTVPRVDQGHQKECIHTFLSNKLRPCQQTGPGYVPGRGSYYVINSGPCYLWTVYTPPAAITASAFSVVFPESVESMQRKLISDYMSDNVVDNLLNVIEAKQALTGLQGTYEFLRRVSSGGRANLRDLSNQFLAYSFGYAPLVSDIRKTVSGMSSIRAQLRRLHSRKTNRVTVTRKSIGTISLPTTDKSDPAWTVGYATSILNQHQPTRIVGLHGVNRVKYETSLFREMDYILSKYIASGPVNLAWEKVPFSFVFDWFVDTSDIISRLDNTLMGGRKEIEHVWTSDKISCLVPTYFKNNTSVFMFDEFEGEQVRLTEYRHYHRKPLPIPDLSIGSSGRFGKKQGALSLALIHQMVANLKRTK